MKNKFFKYGIRTIALLILVLAVYTIFQGIPYKREKRAIRINLNTKNDSSNYRLIKDTIIELNLHKVKIEASLDKTPKGTLLLLHGWNLGVDEWCTKTKICCKAKLRGYNLVLPDMGKSIYSCKYFPETRKDWVSYPTRPWVTDTLIPFLQKEYGLFRKNERNFLVGLSTGARGAALIALDMPDLFKAAAALSGDYDQTKIPGDNLITGFYGSYYNNKKRWETVDNVFSKIKSYKTPTYLGHGKLDKVVPPQQTELFYNELRRNCPDLKVVLNMPDAKHDYDYWDSEVDNILNFFDEIK